jgi:Protein of unknown function (DUF4242)
VNPRLLQPAAYYTVTLSRPADGWGRLDVLGARARQVSDEMGREGVPVRFLRSIFVPEDNACFFLYQAGSHDVVREAARRTQLEVDDIAETIGDDHDARRRAP